MKKVPKILVVGSFIMDLISTTEKVPNEGETIIGLSFSTAPGGKGANQAVQASLLGADVTMVGKIGNDMFGNELVKSAQKAGVKTQYVIKDEKHASGIGNISLEIKEGEKAKNRILLIPGANMSLTVKDVEFLQEKISEYDFVMLQLEIPIEVNEAIISYAVQRGVPVMLNSAPSRDLPEDLLNKLTYISPNEHEAFDLTGIKINEKDNCIDLESVKSVASKLMERGVGTVIITLGSKGAALMNKDKFIYQPCIDIVKVIDPTAAGDSFLGAFSTAVASGMPEEEALEFASFTATVTVSRMGAQPSLPTREEVLDLIKRTKR